MIIAGFIVLAYYADIARSENKDQYFICSVEKLADDYYSMVYTRNGKSYYPHFTHERQVLTFLDYLRNYWRRRPKRVRGEKMKEWKGTANKDGFAYAEINGEIYEKN